MKQEKFSVKSINVDSRVKNTKRILANMQTFVSGTGKGSILLDGDPGVGKTSYVKFLSKLLGIRLVTIEAPHITEEHIINIPFIVFNPKTNHADQKTTREKVTEKDKDFDIVLADSNLFKEIKSIIHIPDNDYLKSIYHGAGSTDDLIKTFEEFGGSESKIPAVFTKIREKFKCILFLDEFFRQTSPRIRNMLRGILNGKIGMHDLPPHVYAMYASNLNDQGVDGIPLNYQFTNINFSAPNKDEWFSWFYSKYNKPNSGVKINEAILQKFHKILSDEHLSYTDFDAEVRTSPRRWEQVLLYINSSLPAKDTEDARSLLTNIEHSFQNYKTKEKSDISSKVMGAVVELIKETSNIDVSSSDTNEGSEWRKTLQHQIEQKIKLAEHRSYVPIISGLPGVGKTSEVIKIADDLDMGLVNIDVSTLDSEDVTGIPLADNDNDKNVSVKFSTPKLYKIIHDKIKAIDKEFINHIKTKYKDNPEKIKELGKRKYQHIIFFDELNRASTKVFNGIRRVLLEKSFSDELKIDERAIVIAAINPEDVGANDLTDHLKDVVDVIHSDPNWKSTLQFIDGMNVDVEHSSSKEISKDTIETFSEKFKSKDKKHKRAISNFYLDIGSSEVYISPREYTDLYANMAYSLDMEISEIFAKYKEFNKDVIEVVERQIRTNLFDSLESSLRNILHKQDSTSPEFLNDLKKWVMKSNDISEVSSLFSQKTETASLQEILKHVFSTGGDLSKEAEFNNYLGNVEGAKFKEDIFGFFREEIQKDVDIIEKMSTKKHTKKKVNDKGAIEEVKDQKVSDVEHMIREIVHALHHNKMSNDFFEHVKDGIKELIIDLDKKYAGGENDFEDVFLSFMGDLIKYVKSLK